MFAGGVEEMVTVTEAAIDAHPDGSVIVTE
jgi:hypothetical protein